MEATEVKFQRNKSNLDQWNLREKLCLVSLVKTIGDQHWQVVSKELMRLCDSNRFKTVVTRPPDWFSQNNCALQYAQLLENIDSFKPGGNEYESDGESFTSDDKAVDIIHRVLIGKHIKNLENLKKQEEERLARNNIEIQEIEADEVTEEKMQQMWMEMEQAREKKRIEEMKMENYYREREIRLKEEVRNWKEISPQISSMNIDADVNIKKENYDQNKDEQQQQVQSGTSPLLSSLLKSSANTNSSAPSLTSVHAGSNNQMRAAATAPTITSLLTSGSIPHSNQPAIILKSCIPPNEAAQLLSRPISGPPCESQNSAAASQTLLSPSQSAPTLSMLLEKNKSAINAANNVSKEAMSTTKLTDSQLSRADSNNEEVPMDIEEDIGSGISTSNSQLPTDNISASTAANDAAHNDSDEPDANEEQQLLEVFKNIGNFELDIDVSAVINEEVDFLKGVEDAMDEDEVKPKSTTDEAEEISKLKNIPSSECIDVTENFSEEKMTTGLSTDVLVESNKEEKIKNEKLKGNRDIISSDDSNDNIPLSAVVSLENKDQRSQEIDANNVNCSRNELNENSTEKSYENLLSKTDTKANRIIEMDLNENRDEDMIHALGSDDVNLKNINIEKSTFGSESGTSAKDETTCDKLAQQLINKLAETHETNVSKHNENSNDEVQSKIAANEDVNLPDLITDLTIDNQESAASDVEGTPPTIAPPIICIADTDENSSLSDTSIIEKKEKSSMNQFISPERKNDQKITDDESSSCSAIPVRPHVLRKLRDRDRSESPMIDSENASASHGSAGDFMISVQRLRRRNSSTHLTESIPNSPASSDRDEFEPKVSKKMLLSIYNAIQPQKIAPVLQKIYSDENKYTKALLSPMDFTTIKKNIESGKIRSVGELQHDIMFACTNALMISNSNSVEYRTVHAFMKECRSARGLLQNRTNDEPVNSKEVKPSQKFRSGFRKSNRFSS